MILPRTMWIATVEPVYRELVAFTVPEIDHVVGAIVKRKVEPPTYTHGCS